MEEGQTFPEFVMTCARAMGAMIMMRDEPLDAPIKLETEDEYHATQAKNARSRIKELESMDHEERAQFVAEQKASEIARMRAILEKEQAENVRLSDMAEQVTAWTPPTPDHENLKSFMLQQIEVNMNSLDYYRDEIARMASKSEIELWEDAKDDAAYDIKYHEKAQMEVNERNCERINWVKQLQDSLK